MGHRNLYAVLVIAVIVMASMVVILRGKGQQTSIVNVSNLNSLESTYYIRLNDTIWQDPLNSASQWHVSYSQPNMTGQLVANGALHLNTTFASEPYSQAVSIYRPVNLSLTDNPVFLISLEATEGIHYGIRISGQDGLGNSFQAWSESSYLQHRSGLGRAENFTIDATLEAYRVNGIFSAAGSSITSLTFYVEATLGQTGEFSLNVYSIVVKAPSQFIINPENRTTGEMDGIVLTVNATNNLGYTDDQFAQGYVDYYLSGTPDLRYTVYYMHGVTVVGQGFYYSASGFTYNIAAFSSSNVVSYPPFLLGNNTHSIVLAPTSGSFFSFQLGGFSVRYLSQAPLAAPLGNIYPSAIIAYYFVFLFVTPVAIVILVSRMFSRETDQTS